MCPRLDLDRRVVDPESLGQLGSHASQEALGLAIRARLAGLETVVIDRRTPPIDRACGEGLMPEGVAQLESFGVAVARIV